MWEKLKEVCDEEDEKRKTIGYQPQSYSLLLKLHREIMEKVDDEMGTIEMELDIVVTRKLASLFGPKPSINLLFDDVFGLQWEILGIVHRCDGLGLPIDSQLYYEFLTEDTTHWPSFPS